MIFYFILSLFLVFSNRFVDTVQQFLNSQNCKKIQTILIFYYLSKQVFFELEFIFICLQSVCTMRVLFFQILIKKVQFNLKIIFACKTIRQKILQHSINEHEISVINVFKCFIQSALGHTNSSNESHLTAETLVFLTLSAFYFA